MVASRHGGHLGALCKTLYCFNTDHRDMYIRHTSEKRRTPEWKRDGVEDAVV